MAAFVDKGKSLIRVSGKLTDSLPLADPAVVQLCSSDESVEVGGGAVVDVVAVVAQVQERLAVVAAVILELLERLNGK